MPDSGTLATRLSLILALVAAVAVLSLPLVQTVFVRRGTAGQEEQITRSRTLLEEEGPLAVALVAFPVIVAAIPMVGERLRPGSRALRVVAAVFLWLFVVLGLASIGWFFALSAIAMTVAALARRNRAPQPESP
jgi:drug/metabolite transporter (DMT)-like permease